MIYEIINMSDALTLKSDDLVIAGVAIAILGGGNYGLSDENDEPVTPVIFGWDQWFEKNNINDLSQFIKDHRPQIADVLDTVLLGSVDDRKKFDETLLKDKEFIKKRNDKMRSSLNDIESNAHRLAAAMRKNV